MIPTLRKFKGGPVQAYLGGGQSRDIFRGGPVKKNTLYLETYNTSFSLESTPQKLIVWSQVQVKVQRESWGGVEKIVNLSEWMKSPWALKSD